MFKNIATKKTYKTKTGEEKTIWQTVGTLKEFNGKQYIELNMFPNVDFYVFENKEKVDGSTSAKNAPVQSDVPDFNLDDF